MAFPAISTGIFGYPVEEAARVALGTVVEEAEAGERTPHQVRPLRREGPRGPREGPLGDGRTVRPGRRNPGLVVIARLLWRGNSQRFLTLWAAGPVIHSYPEAPDLNTEEQAPAPLVRLMGCRQLAGKGPPVLLYEPTPVLKNDPAKNSIEPAPPKQKQLLKSRRPKEAC